MISNHPETKADETLDVTGLLCPLPVLKARKRLESMTAGSVLHVIATDPMAMIDMPHFCSEQHHTLLASEQSGQTYHFRIKRK